MEDKNEQIRKIMISINRIDGVYYQWARGIGLKDNMLSLLYALSDGKPYTQKQICDEWLIPKTTINTVIKECVANGYVILHHEPHTREKLIRLTEKGKEYADGIIGNLRLAEMEAFDETLKKYPVELAEMFAEFADQLKLAYDHYHNKSDPIATTGERKDYDEPIISKNNHRFPD